MTLSTPLTTWLSLQGYGLVTRTLFGADTPPTILRARFDRAASVSRETLKRKFPTLSFESHSFEGLDIEAVRATTEPRCSILHLHGGAFLFGSPSTYRRRAMRFSHRCNAEVFVPDYRLAPEHPYPAALEDAIAAYHWLRRHRPERPIIVTGDSAGGGLALSLLVTLRDREAVLPAGAVLLSPWTDLYISGRSVEANGERDLWRSRAHLAAGARHYVGNADPRSPLLSPGFADLAGLPPLLLFAGEHEVLLDDARRVVERALAAGTDARLVVGKAMQHDWPLTLPWLRESQSAWSTIGAFVEARD